MNEKELRVAVRFAEACLEDVYNDAIKLIKLRRALKRVKKVLRHVLITMAVPKSLEQLTKNVHHELKQ